MNDIVEGLKTNIVQKQLDIIRLRNTSVAFLGSVEIDDSLDGFIDIRWVNQMEFAHLKVDLKTYSFTIEQFENGTNVKMSF
jgi:sucrose phosphorylase